MPTLELLPTSDRGASRRDLSREDVDLLRVLSLGLPADKAARRLHVSGRTLRRRTADLCERLGTDNAVQAVVWAVREDIV